MEAEQLAFHQAVRAGYQALAAADPARWLILDGTQPVEQIHAQVLARVLHLLEAPTAPAIC
jgi:dTMP kinase